MTPGQVRISKFLSLVLRHSPQTAGLALDSAGWVSVDELLRGCARAGHPVTRRQLEEVVAQNDKKRFALSEDGARIRASQGHSVKVRLDYAPASPPEFLYHGTAARFLAPVFAKGLIKGKRHHVHLSPDQHIARAVGQRHGKPVVLRVASGEMHKAGHVFYLSANGVWLTEHVPPEFLREIPG